MAQGQPTAVAIESLYRARYRRFLRVATAIVGDEAAGHDAVQDGFALALKECHSFRGEGSLEGWVWRVVFNAALEARRARVARREASESVDELASGNGRPVDESGVRAWIAALPERQKMVVYLRYYADLDYRAIATALGIEVGTVSATLSAAHQALRRSLEEVQR